MIFPFSQNENIIFSVSAPAPSSVRPPEYNSPSYHVETAAAFAVLGECGASEKSGDACIRRKRNFPFRRRRNTSSYLGPHLDTLSAGPVVGVCICFDFSSRRMVRANVHRNGESQKKKMRKAPIVREIAEGEKKLWKKMENQQDCKQDVRTCVLASDGKIWKHYGHMGSGEEKR